MKIWSATWGSDCANYLGDCDKGNCKGGLESTWMCYALKFTDLLLFKYTSACMIIRIQTTSSGVTLAEIWFKACLGGQWCRRLDHAKIMWMCPKEEWPKHMVLPCCTSHNKIMALVDDGTAQPRQSHHVTLTLQSLCVPCFCAFPEVCAAVFALPRMFHYDFNWLHVTCRYSASYANPTTSVPNVFSIEDWGSNHIL